MDKVEEFDGVAHFIIKIVDWCVTHIRIIYIY